jgi:hypothetical protein
MHEILLSHGYKPVDDAWAVHGRRTYVHDDNADREFLANLERTIRVAGWVCSRDRLRTFRHLTTAEIIEIEPGGSDTSGHFLHYMKQESY